MSNSLVQLALLLIAIGVLALSIRVVRSSATDDLARPLRFLDWGFWGCNLSFVLLPSVVINVLLAAFYVFACFYWTALGVLAHRTGRSWVIWVVAGLATLALGFIASYILMASRVRKKLTAAAHDKRSRNSRDSA
jgi:hypothetical protein